MPDPFAPFSLRLFVFMEMLVNDSDVLIEAEYRAGQEERLRHIVE